MSIESSKPDQPLPGDRADDRLGKEEGKYGDGQSRHEDYEDDAGKRDAAHRDFHDERPDSAAKG